MEERSKDHSSETVHPNINAIPTGVCAGTAREEGDSEKIDPLPGSAVLCAEKEFFQEESNPGFVAPQQVHPMRQIQDAHHSSDKDPTTPRGIRNLHRSYRRLLACPNSASLLPIPWLCSRPQGLRIQSYALRAQYSAKNLHQIGESSGGTTQIQRDSDRSIPGRLVDLGKVTGRMSGSRKESDLISPVPRIQDKLQEIQANSPTKIRMVRPGLGPVSSQDLPTKRKSERDCQTSQKHFVPEDPIEKTTGESAGFSPICLDSRPYSESQTQGHESRMAETCNTSSPGSQGSIPQVVAKTAKTLDPTTESVNVSTPDVSSADPHNSHGCVTAGLGRPLREHGSSRAVVERIPVISHKYARSDGSVPILEEDQPQEEYSHTSHAGQFNNSSLHKQKRVKISTYKPCDTGDSRACSQDEFLPECSPHSRSQERGSRLLVEVSTPRIGMVSGQGILPLCSTTNSGLGDRSVRHDREPSTSAVCSPEPRPSGSGSGCDGIRLEPVGEHLLISPIQHVDGSPRQAQDIQGESSHNSSTMAEEQLVSISSRTRSQAGAHPTTDTQSASAKPDCLRFILEDEQASRADFLKLALGRDVGLSEENVTFLEGDTRRTTKRQYQSGWKKWTTYVREQNPQNISIDFCVSFFKSLHDSGLASSTINSIKSAITVPVKAGFGIELNQGLFNRIPKSCSNQRPKEPPKEIKWSLEKVLEKAASIGVDCKDLTKQTRKTAFLMSLASAGRISEIAALQRGGENIKFLKSGSVRLTPDPLFLAKNEPSDDRWDPWVIPALPGFPQLCPVANLKKYLDMTKQIKDGQLFRGETEGSLLSPKQLADKIVLFINQADPSSGASIHQIRKLAASLNFLQYLDFEGLRKYTGWKSPRVFFKHYLKPIEQLSVPIVAAGKVIHPRKKGAGRGGRGRRRRKQ